MLRERAVRSVVLCRHQQAGCMAPAAHKQGAITKRQSTKGLLVPKGPVGVHVRAGLRAANTSHVPCLGAVRRRGTNQGASCLPAVLGGQN